MYQKARDLLVKHYVKLVAVLIAVMLAVPSVLSHAAEPTDMPNAIQDGLTLGKGVFDTFPIFYVLLGALVAIAIAIGYMKFGRRGARV